MKFALIKKTLQYAKNHKLWLFAAIVSSIISVCGTLAMPVLIGKAVDYVIAVDNVNFSAVGFILIWIAVAVATAAVFNWLSGFCVAKAAYLTSRDIRCAAFAQLNKLPISYIDNHSHGDLTARLTTDTELLAEGLLQGGTQAFNGIATIIGTLIFMFFINAIIAAVVVVLTPLSFFVASLIAKKSHKAFVEQSQVRGELTGLCEEIVSAEKEIKLFAYADRAQTDFEEINNRLYKSGVRSQFISSLSNPSTRFVNSLVYAGVGVIGAITIINGGALSVGGLTSFLQYANQYTKPFNEISSVITEIQTALAAAKRVFTLIEQTPESDDGNLNVLEQCDGTVKMQNVEFSYTPEKPLIKNLNLDVKSGTHIAIVGPTGCGKTTIINLLMRFYDINSGDIFVSGNAIDEITRSSLRKAYGMVLQDSWLFDGTVYENIGYGSDASKEEIIAAAKSAFADDFIVKLKDGYDTYISEQGGNLSEGQKQLLCIARAMLRKPSILILDEATSSVDTLTEQKIQAAFDKLTAGKTSFVVAHRLSTIRNADIILVMKDGDIIEQGNHKALLDKQGFYYQLYNSKD